MTFKKLQYYIAAGLLWSIAGIFFAACILTLSSVNLLWPVIGFFAIVVVIVWAIETVSKGLK